MSAKNDVFFTAGSSFFAIHISLGLEWMLNEVRKRGEPTAAASQVLSCALKYMAVALLVHCKVYIET